MNDSAESDWRLKFINEPTDLCLGFHLTVFRNIFRKLVQESKNSVSIQFVLYFIILFPMLMICGSFQRNARTRRKKPSWAIRTFLG